MKTAIRRDSVLTVMGLALITGVFLFAFYLPGVKANARVMEDTRAAEESVRNIPLRVAEIEALRGDVKRRLEYLAGADTAVPVDPDVHSVIQQVAELARNSNLQITRLEPRVAVHAETYERIPFRLSFSGTFREMAAFLKGLESRERLFAIDQFTLKQKDTKNTQFVEADMDFSVFINHAEFSDFAGNDGSESREMADTENGRDPATPKERG